MGMHNCTPKEILDFSDRVLVQYRQRNSIITKLQKIPTKFTSWFWWALFGMFSILYTKNYCAQSTHKKHSCLPQNIKYLPKSTINIYHPQPRLTPNCTVERQLPMKCPLWQPGSNWHAPVNTPGSHRAFCTSWRTSTSTSLEVGLFMIETQL